jgi:hypothetical protein
MAEINNDPATMLALSVEALAVIAKKAASEEAQRVCHHFAPYSDAEHREDLLSAPYIGPLVGALEELGSGFDIDVVGGSFGVECSEEVSPTEKWVRLRVPQMCQIAEAAGVHYDGWSWEPSGKPPVVASPNLSVLRGS